VKKIGTITVLGILALALTACGAAGVSAQSAGSGAPPVANADSSGASNSAPINGGPASGPSALQLAAGMLKLEGTSNAVTAQQAAQLLPLWQSLGQIESTAAPQGGPQGAPQGTPGPRLSTGMMQQVAAQIDLIKNAMTPAQIQAIADMNLSRQDFFTAFQQAGITMGGPGQGGGGFGANGGTFTPPQGTPPADRTPRAYGASGGLGANGGRQGFGNFIPPSVVTGIVQFLQKKTGS
jgi:hypothetical protein